MAVLQLTLPKINGDLEGGVSMGTDVSFQQDDKLSIQFYSTFLYPFTFAYRFNSKEFTSYFHRNRQLKSKSTKEKLLCGIINMFVCWHYVHNNGINK